MSPATLALGWVYHRRCVTSTIIGATRPEQLEENLRAWDWRPSPEVLARIDEIHLRYTNPAP